ncbi:MAG: sensor domain-containing diguanylate cyclase [Treponema sp.]|nr:sensor domain-containing diguanylate cyclase [Treponema sp.]
MDRKNQRQHAKNLIQQISFNLQTSLNEYYDYTQFWKNYIIQNNGNVPNFETVAEALYSASSSIDSISLSPNGITAYTYPKSMADDSINLFTDPSHRDDAKHARLTKQTTITGPFAQRRGGYSLAIRTPIYTGKDEDLNSFWGFSTISVRMADIFNEAHLSDLKEDNYHYQLKTINTQTGTLDTIDCSTYDALDDPVSTMFAIHNAAWTLFISPKKGWVNYTILFLEIIIGVFVTLLMSFCFTALWLISRRESTFKKVSYLDSLTQLQNSRKFYEQLSDLNSKRQDFAVLYIDLNKFKPINEQYGQRSGDELLVIVAKKLKNCIREGDEVFRIGDDEFAVIIPNQITINGLSNLMQRIKQSIERPTVLGAATVQITAAIGYARYPQDGDTFEAIVQSAEEMMYADKTAIIETR